MGILLSVDRGRGGTAVTELRSRLGVLARNFRWVWDVPTQELFRQVDPWAWSSAHDPVALVRAASPDRLAQLAADELFTHRLGAVEEGLARYLTVAPGAARVAYFCMEHGIAPSLRNYAGGLGMLAGCIEKTASDLAVPMVAVGLMYQWWFRQRLDQGWQEEDWQHLDPAGAGLDRCAERVTVELAGEPVAIQLWRARIGRLNLYLLDTDVPENPEHLRGITDRVRPLRPRADRAVLRRLGPRVRGRPRLAHDPRALPRAGRGRAVQHGRAVRPAVREHQRGVPAAPRGHRGAGARSTVAGPGRADPVRHERCASAHLDPAADGGTVRAVRGRRVGLRRRGRVGRRVGHPGRGAVGRTAGAAGRTRRLGPGVPRPHPRPRGIDDRGGPAGG